MSDASLFQCVLCANVQGILAVQSRLANTEMANSNFFCASPEYLTRNQHSLINIGQMQRTIISFLFFLHSQKDPPFTPGIWLNAVQPPFFVTPPVEGVS